MPESLRKGFTVLDWENEKILFLNGDFYLSSLNQRTTRLKKVNLKQGEQDKIKAKQAEVFALASNNHFENLKNDFGRQFLSSTKPLQLLKDEEQFLTKLFNGELNNSISSKEQSLNVIESYPFGISEKSVKEISNAYSILNDGQLDYSKYHPKANHLFAVPVEDVFIETNSLQLFHKWIIGFKSKIDAIFNQLYKEVEYDINTPKAGGYLNTLAYCIKKEGIEYLLGTFDRLHEIYFHMFESDFKYIMYFQVVSKLLSKSTKLIENHFAESSDFAKNKEFISQNLRALYFSYQLSNNLSLEFRHNIDINPDFMEILKVNVSIRNVFKTIHEKYDNFINRSIVVNKTYRVFEFEFLNNALSIDAIISASCKEKRHQDIAYNSAFNLINNISEDFEYAREVFLNNWLVNRHKHNPNLTEVDYINHVLVYLDNHFFNIHPVDGQIKVVDSKDRSFTFNFVFFSDYVLPFFQSIKEELLNNLNKIEAIKRNSLGYKKEKESDTFKNLNPFLYRPTNLSDERRNENLKSLYAHFTKGKTPVIKSAIGEENFIKLMSGVECDKQIVWLFDQQDFRYFIFKLSSHGYHSENSIWTTAVSLFLNKKGNTFNERKVQTSNGSISLVKENLLNRAIDTLQGIK